MIYSDYILLIISGFLICFSDGEEKLETYCNINGERALQYVSDKFLSISIDPAVLVAGLNLSDSSLLLAQHLSPAYIRIAGPSTKFVQYNDNEDKSTDRLSEDGNNVVVTPSMWFGINEWLRLANLTPVFGINDIETTRGVWNPKSTLLLLEISDKLNVSCYWQLGFDSFQKTEAQYKQDLSVFYHLLTAFPERNETWKIVGSDISTLPKARTENTMEELKDIVTAVMWEPRDVTEESFPEKDMGWKILHQQHKPNVKIWTSIPKSSEPISFSSALLWATQVGEAAKFGYEVVFRQPRLHEIFSDTPAYWFSLLHKKLMGNKVLDVKTPIYYPGSTAYAHCTRKQNDFAGKGALTVMIVNNNLQKYKTKVKLGATPVEKSMEVLSYILTSSAGNSTDIYLNGKKLTIDLLSEDHVFEPKQRKTKSKSYISLEVPPHSIGFFVLPDADLPICVNEENVVNQTQEIVEEQNPLSEETALNLESRGTFKKHPNLQEMAQKMKKEMQSDERFYKTNSDLEELKKESDSAEDTIKTAAARKSFIEKAKLAAKQKKHADLEKRKEDIRKFILDRSKTIEAHKPETRMEIKSKNLELTSEEVEKVLKDRAKARAAERDVIFTDDELEALLQKSSKQFLKSKLKKPVVADSSRRKRDINMEVLDKQMDFDTSEEATEYFQEINKLSQNINKRPERSPRDINMKLLDVRTKLEENRQRIEDKKYEILGNTQTIKENIKDRIRNLKHKNRYRRDINMDLLKIKTEGQKKAFQRDEEKKPKRLFKHKVDKEATIRRPGQTSDELLEELEDEDDISIEKPQVMPKVEVYAELALPEEEIEDIDFFNINNKPKKTGIFDRKPIVNPSFRASKKKKEKNALTENLQFLTTSEEFTDFEEDLPCIHEFFGSDFKDSGGTKNKKVIHELGETRLSERRFKKGKNSNKKMADLEDMMSSEKDPFEELRMKRDAQYIKALSNDLPYSKKHVNEKLEEKVEEMLNGQKNVKSGESYNGVPENVVKVEESKLFQYGIEEIDLDDSDESVSTDDHITENVPELKESDREVEKNTNKMVDWPLLNKDESLQSLFQEEESRSPEEKSGTIKISISMSNEDQLDQKLDNQNEQDSSESESLMVKNTEEEKVESTNLRKKRNVDEATEGNGKLIFKEKKNKNKQKLSHFKRKKGEDSIAEQRDDIVGEIYQIEKEKTNKLIEQLQTLKNILSQRKKELDKYIVKDSIGKKNKKGKKIEKNSSNNMRKENIKTLTEVERTKESIENTQIKITPTSLTRRLKKRSVFDKFPDGFGSYKPLTPRLKSWRPSDILSLKRDANLLSSRNLKPTNDYQLYTNMFDQNRYFQKRSIGSDLKDLDNYIDKDGNDIEKDTMYVSPKLRVSKSEDKSLSDVDLNENMKQIVNTPSTNGATDKETKEEISTTVDPILYYTFDDDLATEIEGVTDVVTESIMASTMAARTLDIDDQGQKVFMNFVSNVSDFFRKVGRKIESYVRDISIF